MKMIFDGHEYSYTDDTGILRDNYGAHVATLEKCNATDEYYYAVDADDADIVYDSIHENVIANNVKARGQWVMQAYAATY